MRTLDSLEEKDDHFFLVLTDNSAVASATFC